MFKQQGMYINLQKEGENGKPASSKRFIPKNIMQVLILKIRKNKLNQ